MSGPFLSIDNLHVEIGGKEILKGLDLQVGRGEVHVLMGPNGAGKSTLANVLMGHPQYEVTQGSIVFQGQPLNGLKPHQRAQKGLFLSFQYPAEIAGISLGNFLRSAKMAVDQQPLKIQKFQKILKEKMRLLEMDEKYASRYLNKGFSGGEKKKSEILQMLVLEPKLAILDETDSGLDVDAVRVVASGVRQFHNSRNSILIITHHKNLLDYIEADRVHFLVEGRLVKSGGRSLLEGIEESGFQIYKKGGAES
ncbi:MAG: Fe-S cluster assembly ATPase SufC [Firmicutes bacterium]|nr:Fe-S cluster assembly ATPase SufC [Bacillota bacterium]